MTPHGARPRKDYTAPAREERVQVHVGGSDVRLDPLEANALFGEIRRLLAGGLTRGGVAGKPSKTAIVLAALRCYRDDLKSRAVMP